MIVSYPRSGQNLLKHLIKACGVEVTAHHGLSISENLPKWFEQPLILLIRDYKECVVRNLSHEYDAVSIINGAFSRTDMHGISKLFENLFLYHIWQNEKHLIYYEDLITDKKYFLSLAGELNLDTDSLDWEHEFNMSLENYQDQKHSGGDIHFHSRKLTDPQYFDERMSAYNPELFELYLKRYAA